MTKTSILHRTNICILIVTGVMALSSCRGPVSRSGADAGNSDSNPEGRVDGGGGDSTQSVSPTSQSPSQSPAQSPGGEKTALAPAPCGIEYSGKVYIGLGGVKIDKIYKDEAPGDKPGSDRLRLKTSQQLTDSYARIVTGDTPFSFDSYSPNFGTTVVTESEPKIEVWSTAPIASVFSNYGLYVMGLETARTYLQKSPAFSKKITEAEVKDGCKNFALRAWNRTPPQSMIDDCYRYFVSLNPEKLSAEEHWALTLAPILSSIDFIAY